MIRSRVDQSQAAIVAAFRERGGVVESRLSKVGKGCPDLLVGYRGITLVVEVKTAGYRTSPDTAKAQARWAALWDTAGCAVPVVRTPSDVHDLLDTVDAFLESLQR